jgi:hypothetical protein
MCPWISFSSAISSYNTITWMQEMTYWNVWSCWPALMTPSLICEGHNFHTLYGDVVWHHVQRWTMTRTDLRTCHGAEHQTNTYMFSCWSELSLRYSVLIATLKFWQAIISTMLFYKPEGEYSHGSLLDPIMSQMKPVTMTIRYLFQIYFNITLPSSHRSPK